MLLAIVRVSGKPGDGNKKLSPSLERRFITVHSAKLPPSVR